MTNTWVVVRSSERCFWYDWWQELTESPMRRTIKRLSRQWNCRRRFSQSSAGENSDKRSAMNSLMKWQMAVDGRQKCNLVDGIQLLHSTRLVQERNSSKNGDCGTNSINEMIGRSVCVCVGPTFGGVAILNLTHLTATSRQTGYEGRTTLTRALVIESTKRQRRTQKLHFVAKQAISLTTVHSRTWSNTNSSVFSSPLSTTLRCITNDALAEIYALFVPFNAFLMPIQSWNEQQGTIIEGDVKKCCLNENSDYFFLRFDSTSEMVHFWKANSKLANHTLLNNNQWILSPMELRWQLMNSSTVMRFVPWLVLLLVFLREFVTFDSFDGSPFDSLWILSLFWVPPRRKLSDFLWKLPIKTRPFNRLNTESTIKATWNPLVPHHRTFQSKPTNRLH